MTDTQQPVLDDDTAVHSMQLLDSQFLADLRRQMLKFATLQLADHHLAEDAVQEALAGALQNARAFGGRAALKTWVFAILKHKIADSLRYKQRVTDASSLLRSEDEEQDFAALFDARGHWPADERPGDWGNPHETVREGQFWRVFEACLENLPGAQARVFMMREFIELESDEICNAVEISLSNLNVMLYRARMRLRECLDSHWFMEHKSSC
jgi:RNA polymerase sigma-70 factor (TIGR02943 family)